MAMKDYSDEFRADAVAPYESTPGATYKTIAADLGVNRATLREWVLRDRERCGITAAAAKPAVPRRKAVPSADPDEPIRQVEARVAELEASERKLATERDILRKAPKYFAGETNCEEPLPVRRRPPGHLRGDVGTRRRHSVGGHLSPNEYERRRHKAKITLAA
ncbi:transposase [Streptomyces sp. NPDC006173]|uniref:transposase n=1 Tax=Streptomyces sp. NPDC006173 TaxID=3155349 RepID=UPI0033E620B1